MKENVYGDQAADIDYSTPETDALLAKAAADHGTVLHHDDWYAMCDLARKLERERDEARWHADADVLGSIECGSARPSKKGWRHDCEASEWEMRYAAKRGLIERHPVHATSLRIISEIPAEPSNPQNIASTSNADSA